MDVVSPRGTGREAKPYLGPHDNTRLEHHLRTRAELLGFPKDEVGELTHFDRPDVGVDAVRDGTTAPTSRVRNIADEATDGHVRVDGVFRDVALHATVVTLVGIPELGEGTTERSEFARGSPGPR